MGFFIVIDQGTTSTGVSLFTEQGKWVSEATAPVRSVFPRDGWVEQNPDEIWQGVKISIEKLCLEKAIFARDIKGLGITNQRETVVAVDTLNKRVLSPAIVWQCRRTEEFCHKIKNQKWITQLTGLPLDPYFSASKMRWLLQNNSAVKMAQKEGRLKFLTIDAFLCWKLTGEFYTDITNASRTLLMGLKSQKWEPKLLKFFGLDEENLPVIKSNTDEFGIVTQPECIKGIPLVAMIGDQQSALFGHSCFQKGQGKLTLGTGSFLLVNSGNKLVLSKKRLVSTVGWRLKAQKPVYALEGSVFTCGAAIDWTIHNLKLASSPKGLNEIAQQVTDSNGVVFVPAFVGLGAPHWNSSARAAFLNLNLGVQGAHMARAIFEGLALMNADLQSAFEADLGQKLKVLKVDGGVAASDLLMQIHSDLMNLEIVRPKESEQTTWGVLKLLCRYFNIEIDSQIEMSEAHIFTPAVEMSQSLNLKKNWKKALKQVC